MQNLWEEETCDFHKYETRWMIRIDWSLGGVTSICNVDCVSCFIFGHIDLQGAGWWSNTGQYVSNAKLCEELQISWDYASKYMGILSITNVRKTCMYIYFSTYVGSDNIECKFTAKKPFIRSWLPPTTLEWLTGFCLYHPMRQFFIQIFAIVVFLSTS